VAVEPDITFDFSTPAAAGEANSLAGKNVAKRVGSAEPTSSSEGKWRCQNCGIELVLYGMDQMDFVLKHWRDCPNPDEEMVSRRERSGLVEGIIPLSPSRLSTYEMCPRMEYFSSKDPNRVKMAAGAAADLGNAIHTYAETGEDPPHDLPLEFVDDWAWMKRSIDRFKADLPAGEFAEFREHVMNWHYDLPDGRVVKFQGKADRVIIWPDESIEAFDYKSGRKVLAEGQIEDDEQTHDYLVGIRRDFPFGRRFRFHQIQLRFGEVETSDWYDSETIETWDRLLGVKAAKYANEKLWAPKPGTPCRFCDYLHRCDAGMKWRGDGTVKIAVLEGPIVVDSDEAVAQAHELVARAEPTIKALKEGIKTYVERNGPTSVEGGEYREAIVDRTRLKDKPSAFKRLVELLKSESEAWKLFNYNHTSGAKYLEGPKSDPVLAKNVYVYPDSSIRFVPDNAGKKRTKKK
jgi:hypothetical protein